MSKIKTPWKVSFLTLFRTQKTRVWNGGKAGKTRVSTLRIAPKPKKGGLKNREPELAWAKAEIIMGHLKRIKWGSKRHFLGPPIKKYHVKNMQVKWPPKKIVRFRWAPRPKTKSRNLMARQKKYLTLRAKNPKIDDFRTPRISQDPAYEGTISVFRAWICFREPEPGSFHAALP